MFHVRFLPIRSELGRVDAVYSIRPVNPEQSYQRLSNSDHQRGSIPGVFLGPTPVDLHNVATRVLAPCVPGRLPSSVHATPAIPIPGGTVENSKQLLDQNSGGFLNVVTFTTQRP
jgi:hypothetical protein